ncbi:DUF456 domain-containing protein [Streptomyces odontomachi]|uniref:DUF456 domain-containing protein n=1 Tax=Streptomyces odontomachi TaxID=2944940 RepID=UPI00210C0E2D|nr:DUF456 domain-containing protein [Streptomyces sp. ODS25]
MGVPELLLVGLVMLLGLAGVLVPGVPGPWLVWAAVLWWALQDRSRLAGIVLAGTTGILLAAQAVRWQLPSRRRGAGDGLTHRLALRAGAGALIGFCVLPVIGAVPGFVGGIYLAERVRLGGRGEAVTATRAAMRSGGWSVLAELFACLLITAAWLGALAW